jgi:hypothetical protein
MSDAHPPPAHQHRGSPIPESGTHRSGREIHLSAVNVAAAGFSLIPQW